MTFFTFWLGYFAGATSMAVAILFCQRLVKVKRQEDAANAAAAHRFGYWMDEREFNDRAVRQNRRASDAPPHTLALLRTEHDRKHGGSW